MGLDSSVLRCKCASWVLAIIGSFLLVVPAAAQEISTDLVSTILQQPDRLQADIERDQRSKPQFVIPHLALQVGDTVLDIFGSGGYYSELLARAVGEEGEAILHNNDGFEAWGINGLSDRFANRNPGSITRHTRSGINLDVAAESLDAALIVMALHDLYVIPKRYNGEEYVAVGPPANVAYFYEQLLAALKPGGRFVVVDHAGEPGMLHEEVTDLHRIDEEFLKREIEGAGFRFVSSDGALRNSADDRSRIVFDEDLQGKTDRFVLVFEKP